MMAMAMSESTELQSVGARVRPEGDVDPAPGTSGLGAGAQADGLPESAQVTAESVVEALLFATDSPLPAARIAKLLGVGDVADVKTHIEKLNRRYEEGGASFRVEMIAKGYQLLTLPVYGRWISKLHKSKADMRLSQAALETLAVVAYKQPALRADIESVRGVAVGDMLVRLREMNLVRIVGRAEEIGRPLLYGTTNRFLEVFGLASLGDLPQLDPDRPGDVPPLALPADGDDSSLDDSGPDPPEADGADPGMSIPGESQTPSTEA